MVKLLKRQEYDQEDAMYWDKDGLLLTIVLLIIAPYIIVPVAEKIWSYMKHEKTRTVF